MKMKNRRLKSFMHWKNISSRVRSLGLEWTLLNFLILRRISKSCLLRQRREDCGDVHMQERKVLRRTYGLSLTISRFTAWITELKPSRTHIYAKYWRNGRYH